MFLFILQLLRICYVFCSLLEEFLSKEKYEFLTAKLVTFLINRKVERHFCTQSITQKSVHRYKKEIYIQKEKYSLKINV